MTKTLVLLMLAAPAAFPVTFNSPWVLPANANAFALGDFNGDGKPDIAVTNSGANDTVTIWLQKSGQPFQPAASYAVGNVPNAIAVADFNGDGKLDLAVVNSGPASRGGNSVSILLGNGDGTFQPQMTVPVGNTPVALAVVDFDGDGTSDLAVLNHVSNTISILLGNGDGTFQPAANTPAGTNTFIFAVGDLNGDGLPDLVLVLGSRVQVLLNKGGGMFQRGADYPVGGLASGITRI